MGSCIGLLPRSNKPDTTIHIEEQSSQRSIPRTSILTQNKCSKHSARHSRCPIPVAKELLFDPSKQLETHSTRAPFSTQLELGLLAPTPQQCCPAATKATPWLPRLWVGRW